MFDNKISKKPKKQTEIFSEFSLLHFKSTLAIAYIFELTAVEFKVIQILEKYETQMARKKSIPSLLCVHSFHVTTARYVLYLHLLI